MICHEKAACVFYNFAGTKVYKKEGGQLKRKIQKVTRPGILLLCYELHFVSRLAQCIVAGYGLDGRGSIPDGGGGFFL
jgi:hypothetical protein